MKRRYKLGFIARPREQEKPDPPVNYYVNPELAGGAPSTPGNSNPPTGHTIGFGTINSQPLDNGDGTFNWQCNQEQASGRTYLAYEISTNNPDLQVGDKVKFIYDVENKSDSTSLLCFTVTGASNVVQTIINSSVPVGQKRTVSLNLEITALPYTAQVRVGTGVTSNNIMWIEISNPRMYYI